MKEMPEYQRGEEGSLSFMSIPMDCDLQFPSLADVFHGGTPEPHQQPFTTDGSWSLNRYHVQCENDCLRQMIQNDEA